MYLLDLKKQFADLHIHRNGEFRATGKLEPIYMDYTLSYLSSKQYLSKVTEKVSCLVTTEELVELVSDRLGIIVSNNPRGLFCLIHNIFSKMEHRKKTLTEIGSNCLIHNSAIIAKTNVKIGNNAKIGANVHIGENVTIGDDCELFPGVIIGTNDIDACKIDGKLICTDHTGGVVIGDGVTIFSGTTISRAIFMHEYTTVGDYTKIGCNVHISHGCNIGSNCYITPGVTFAGYVTSGDDCYFGAGCTIKQLLDISHNAFIGMGAVIIDNVESGRIVAGNPAREIKTANIP